jgi:hypothetical protein
LRNLQECLPLLHIDFILLETRKFIIIAKGHVRDDQVNLGGIRSGFRLRVSSLAVSAKAKIASRTALLRSKFFSSNVTFTSTRSLNPLRTPPYPETSLCMLFPWRPFFSFEPAQTIRAMELSQWTGRTWGCVRGGAAGLSEKVAAPAGFYIVDFDRYGEREHGSNCRFRQVDQYLRRTSVFH